MADTPPTIHWLTLRRVALIVALILFAIATYQTHDLVAGGLALLAAALL